MHDIGFDLLILLAGTWLVAVTLQPLRLPTVMGELIVGVLVGPAVLGWIEPNEAIQLLAEIGIFFLMFHAGVETQPSEFFDALKRSLGVAVVGALVPFGVSFAVATAFGLDRIAAVFVGLTMTATAVVITLKSLKDLGLANTGVARIIVASCVIDDLLTLVVFGMVISLLAGGAFEPTVVAFTLFKVLIFFVGAALLGRFLYPRFTLPFKTEGGKGFTFVLLMAVGAGVFAEAIGLHMILGAYLAGLFFEEKVAHPNLVKVVNDRAYGIAYSFLGPIFFISLGFSITFDIGGREVAFLVLLTSLVIVGQITSAGGMALRMGMPLREALTVGVGMCGRAEMAFILASLALAQGAIDQSVFSVLIFTAFVLNLFTPMALKGCAVMLEQSGVSRTDPFRGVVQIDIYGEPLIEDSVRRLQRSLPNVEDNVVLYGYGPEIDFLLTELAKREIPHLILEEDEKIASRLFDRGRRVALVSVAEGEVDYGELAKARAVVANGPDDCDALLALGLREQGFEGPIVALIDTPSRRSPMTLAGASAAFTPSHVLAAVVASRASSKIGPRVAGALPLLNEHLEVAELRIHDRSALLGVTLVEARIREQSGANIIGQWRANQLEQPPEADQKLEAGMILIAAGSAESILRLSELARPINEKGTLLIVGGGGWSETLREMLTAAGEVVCTVADREGPHVDIVGDFVDSAVLEEAGVNQAKAVILALESDSVTLFATAAIRDMAPHVPLIAGLEKLENVERAQHAGCDVALSLSQVAGQILIRHVLGETVSLQPRIKLVKATAGPLSGRELASAGIRQRTGCSIVAVGRNDDLLVDLPPSFGIEQDDELYLCGTNDAVERYRKTFPDSLR